MIASLGMYDRPEVAHANDAFWCLVRDNLGYGPDQLTRDLPFWDIWRSPDLLFSQTCGLPFRSSLHQQVQLVGTPDYGVHCCPPGYYNSVIVTRKASGTSFGDISALKFAFNERLSQSGWAAFWGHIPAGDAPKELIETGGHAASAKTVANGTADIASLDALTWELINRFDAFSDQLEVIATTQPTPGLPYITALGNNASAIRLAVQAAIGALDTTSRDALHLKSVVEISADKYLAIPMPPS